jgi:hypothetical protein
MAMEDIDELLDLNWNSGAEDALRMEVSIVVFFLPCGVDFSMSMPFQMQSTSVQ